MTVRTQNMDILSAVAGKQAAASGGARATEGGTPFVDLMAALGAQSESLVDAAKQTVLLDRQPAGAKADGSPAVIDPLHLLSRHRQGTAEAVPAREEATPGSAVRADGRVRSRVEGVDEPLAQRDLALPAEEVVVDGVVTGEHLHADEVRPGVERPAESSDKAGVQDLAREIASLAAGAERAAAGKPADLREAAVRMPDPRVAGNAATAVQRQEGAAGAVDVQAPAELMSQLKAGSRAADAAPPVRDNNRAADASNAFSEALLRAAQGGQENTAATPVAAKEVRPPAATSHVDQPFGTQQWGVAMNAQVLTMMKDGVAQARVQINPQNLGPVGIDLSMRDGVVNVSFDSPYTEVREALRDGVKGLERSLSEGGVQLGRVEVRDSLDFMAQGRPQRDAQQDPSGGQRQQQEWRQGRRDESDFASHLQLTDEDNAGG